MPTRSRTLREGEQIVTAGGGVDEIRLITVGADSKVPHTREVEVRVVIDTQAIAESLGRRAFFSKSRKTAFMGGQVKVTVEKVRGE